MIVKTITFEDLEGNEVTESFHFHFNKLELLEKDMELGGLEKVGNELSETQDGVKAYTLFRDLLLDAYGKKSPDGRRFLKSPEIRAELAHSDALGEIILELLADGNKAAEFFNGLVPAKLLKQAQTESGNTSKETPELDAAAPVLEKKSEELTDEELLAMDPKKMDRDQLIRAMRLRSAG